MKSKYKGYPDDKAINVWLKTRSLQFCVLIDYIPIFIFLSEMFSPLFLIIISELKLHHAAYKCSFMLIFIFLIQHFIKEGSHF